MDDFRGDRDFNGDFFGDVEGDLRYFGDEVTKLNSLCFLLWPPVGVLGAESTKEGEPHGVVSNDGQGVLSTEYIPE